MIDVERLPRLIDSGVWDAGHVQGIALDLEESSIYFSFTTMLVKRSLDGKLLGTVEGIAGHLGCLAFNWQDKKVYASLEYKQDQIGRSIYNKLGKTDQPPVEDGFYVAIFDGSKINRAGMDAEKDGVMRTVFLPEVLADYKAEVRHGNDILLHRYGCSGIDGITFGPPFGSPNGEEKLYVAYGIYGDVMRNDNDYQIILCYDISDWGEYAEPLYQRSMSRKGPLHPDAKYFVFTGNTTYGIQNLEYDPHTSHWFCAVYRGNKTHFPNNDLYIIDGTIKPQMKRLKGIPDEWGLELQLWQQGISHDSGIYSWQSEHGTTGLFSLGNGYFYISHPGKNEQGQYSLVHLYRWTGVPPCPFEMV